MSQIEFNVAPGKDLIVNKLLATGTATGQAGGRPLGLNPDVFQEVSVDGLPYFTFRPLGADPQDRLDAIKFPSSHAATAPVVPLVVNQLRYAIPHGMKRLTHLLEGVEVDETGIIRSVDPSVGQPMAAAADGVEAISVNVLHNPVLDQRGASRLKAGSSEALNIAHFCTEVASTGLDCGRGGNCPRITRVTQFDVDAKGIVPVENGDLGNYLCASIPLKSFIRNKHSDGSGGLNRFFKYSPIYRLFREYLDIESLPDDPIRMVATHLPDQTVLWIPVVQEEWNRIHKLLTSGLDAGMVINGETIAYRIQPFKQDEVLFSWENGYLDEMDTWFGFPATLLPCPKAGRWIDKKLAEQGH